MSARDQIRRYVSLLGDMWTPPSTTDARVEQVYAAVRAEVLREAEGVLRAHADRCEDVQQRRSWKAAANVLGLRADAAERGGSR